MISHRPNLWHRVGTHPALELRPYRGATRPTVRSKLGTLSSQGGRAGNVRVASERISNLLVFSRRNGFAPPLSLTNFHIPQGVHEVDPNVSVLHVVGVFPHVEHQQGDCSVGEVAVVVVDLLDQETLPE